MREPCLCLWESVWKSVRISSLTVRIIRTVYGYKTIGPLKHLKLAGSCFTCLFIHQPKISVVHNGRFQREDNINTNIQITLLAM